MSKKLTFVPLVQSALQLVFLHERKFQHTEAVVNVPFVFYNGTLTEHHSSSTSQMPAKKNNEFLYLAPRDQTHGVVVVGQLIAHHELCELQKKNVTSGCVVRSDFWCWQTTHFEKTK